MSWSLIAYANCASGADGGTTSAIGTTGADLIVIVAKAIPEPGPLAPQAHLATYLETYPLGVDEVRY
jgi:hypothetical protein